MIITCPSCDTRYNVDAAGFEPSGRKVRCAKCGEHWHQEPESAQAKEDAEELESAAAPETESSEAESSEDVPPPPPPLAPDFGKPSKKSKKADDEDEAAPARSRPRHQMPVKARGSRTLQVAGWVALIAFVAGSALGAAAFRSEIIRLWPATQTLYAAFNDPVDIDDMAFQNVSYEYQFENGLPVLSIRGEVINEGEARIPLRPVQIDLRGENRERLYHWTFRLPETALDPAERAEFVTRLSSPPLEARDLVIRFTEEEDTPEGEAEKNGDKTDGEKDEAAR